MGKLPNFLIVGAAKSGTTSLFYYLNQHPDIYIPPIKECRFFSQMPRNRKGLGAEKFQNEGIRDWEEYKKLFANRKEKALGDISNDYLYFYEKSIKNIKKYLGDKVKIIIILRNPIDRAYSNYLHAIRDGWENLSFEEALDKEEERIKEGWAWPYHYVNVGFYYKQVKAYLENFSHVKIFIYEEFFKNLPQYMNELLNFLNVPPIEIKNFSVKNPSGFPKNKILHKLITQEYLIKKVFKVFIPYEFRSKIVEFVKLKNLEKKPMKEETRKKLKEIFYEDVKNLSILLNKDLERMWLGLEK